MRSGPRVVLCLSTVLRFPKNTAAARGANESLLRELWKNALFFLLLSSVSARFFLLLLLLALMGIKHSSRCMLLRRKMAESESSEVSLRDTFDSSN